jgi:hypothetical protein
MVPQSLNPKFDAGGNNIAIISDPPIAGYTPSQQAVFREDHEMAHSLQRMRQYFLDDEPADQLRVAGGTGNRVAANVHATFNDRQLPEEQWPDPVQLVTVVLDAYCDQSIVSDYRTDHGRMKQKPGKTVTRFHILRGRLPHVRLHNQQVSAK